MHDAGSLFGLLAAADSTSFFGAENLVALLTLTALEIILGIDNVIFIAVLAGKLPPDKREKARTIGIAMAVITRVLLLLSISFLMRLTKPLVTLLGHDFSGKDLILLTGGLFLIAKSTFEVHEKLEGEEHTAGGKTKVAASLVSITIQIMLLDIVFSLDSVITAVGMSNHLGVMIVAVVIAAGVMLAFSGAVSRFVERRPTMKMLAMAFLILIGVMLVSEGFGKHIEKGYIYFAMAFSFAVELLNHRLRPAGEPVHLRNVSMPADKDASLRS